jgi:pimeloyl-ACP methyl ester carboxylesterase
VLGWNLCMHAPQRVERFVALSVGHPAACTEGGALQLLKAFDWHALRGLASSTTRFEAWRTGLARPGRLTAAQMRGSDKQVGDRLQ